LNIPEDSDGKSNASILIAQLCERVQGNL
jgi:hypothetical protein